jgi:hypothetical protein
LGLSTPRWWGPFVVVATDNGANIDLMDADGEKLSSFVRTLLVRAPALVRRRHNGPGSGSSLDLAPRGNPARPDTSRYLPSGNASVSSGSNSPKRSYVSGTLGTADRVSAAIIALHQTLPTVGSVGAHLTHLLLKSHNLVSRRVLLALASISPGGISGGYSSRCVFDCSCVCWLVLNALRAYGGRAALQAYEGGQVKTAPLRERQL